MHIIQYYIYQKYMCTYHHRFLSPLYSQSLSPGRSAAAPLTKMSLKYLMRLDPGHVLKPQVCLFRLSPQPTDILQEKICIRFFTF